MTDWTPPGSQRVRPMSPLAPSTEYRQVFPVLPPAGTVLHPLTNREVLTRASRVFTWDRGAFNWTALAVAAVVHSLLLVLWLVLWPVFGSVPGAYAGFALAVLLWSVGHWFTVGCVAFVFSRVVVGHRVVFADLVAWLTPLAWRLLGLSTLCAVLVPVGLVGGVVPGLLACAAFAVACPVLVLERLTVREALARSRDLVRGQEWRTLRLVAIWCPYWIVGGVVLLLIVHRAGVIGSDGNPLGWLLFAALVGTLTIGAGWATSGILMSMHYVDRYLTVATRPAPPVPSPVTHVDPRG